jgi:hypothetical protein
MNEELKKLAEASGWTIPEERLQEIAAIYKGTMDDTAPLREMDPGTAVPTNIFTAEYE